MKIEDLRNNSEKTTFGKLNVGDVFSSYEKIYIKLGNSMCHGNSLRVDGELFYLNSTDIVCKLNAKLVIEPTENEQMKMRRRKLTFNTDIFEQSLITALKQSFIEWQNAEIKYIRMSFVNHKGELSHVGDYREQMKIMNDKGEQYLRCLNALNEFRGDKEGYMNRSWNDEEL